MPGFDGTGPDGLGEMTGRGLGYCVVPIDSNARDWGQRMSNADRSYLNQVHRSVLQRGLSPLRTSVRNFRVMGRGGGRMGRCMRKGMGFGR